MTTSPVRLSVAEGVAEIVLDRPEKRNAIDRATEQALAAILDEVAASPARAVVIRGEGPGFCAGRDLSDAEPLTEDAEAILRDRLNPLVAALAALRVPTIAAVHGPALGTGLGLALACDLVVVAEGARVGSPFARIGAVLDSGAHQFLVDRIGPSRTLELVYTGRLLTGIEAAAWGIANQVVPDADLLTVVRGLAASIASGPTFAFAASKAIVRRIRDDRLGLAEVLAAEAAGQGAAARTHDYAEGITAFQQKRTPTFTGV